MPDPPSADSARARNRALFEGAFGEIYGLYIEQERLSRVIAALMWGADVRPLYASMRVIGEVRDGGVIVDVPCGAGVAFRGIRAGQDVRYIAIDLSPRMLERARRRATQRGLGQIELVEGDAQSIPVEAASVDLLLSYWGLHCFPDPAQAVTEATRCLRPGGRLTGCTITRGRSWRHRLLVQPGRGGFGPGGTVEDLRHWLVDARLEALTVESSGLFAYFEAVKSPWRPPCPVLALLPRVGMPPDYLRSDALAPRAVVSATARVTVAMDDQREPRRLACRRLLRPGEAGARWRSRSSRRLPSIRAAARR